MGFLTEEARVLVVGAGGLGCEAVKNLLLYDVAYIEAVDMDTVEISNLSRTLAFQQADVGRTKVEALVDWVHDRFPHFLNRFSAHCMRIEDMPLMHLASFHIIIGGLDSLETRRYLNAQLVALSKQGRTIPYIDGGTEGFQGHVSIIIPGITACIECLSGLFVGGNVPICTLAGTPRTAGQCVLWAVHLGWRETYSFNSQDTDHLRMIVDLAASKAEENSIHDSIDIDMVRHTLGHLIPTLLSTNAIIAAVMAKQAIALLSGEEFSGHNWYAFNGGEGTTLSRMTIEPSGDCILECCKR